MSVLSLQSAVDRDIAFGDFGQITTEEVKNELLSRGYNRATALSVPTQVPTVSPIVPRVTALECIRMALTVVLGRNGYAATCASYRGCSIPDYKFDAIVNQATSLALNMYNMNSTYVSNDTGLPVAVPVSPSYQYPTYVPATYVDSPIAPLPTYNPSSWFFGLEGFGQSGTATPPGSGMSSADKMALAMSILSMIAGTVGSYYQAKAERERLAALGVQIPQMSAQETNAMLQQWLATNPNVSKDKAGQIAAGLFDQPKPASTMPSWVMPAMVGVGVLAVMGFMKK